ncbi:auxin-responsive protein SAUR50-like [Herrania umbratica]|uniref:Auxin-responsive protein SAUR50-like n=1 Tax=Herrania umbratica TaxID=108875 RepID=A0A6J1AG11_9ROSI|nr:auxin-responsive protein SAUR50-like [Herrania umbratica]
MSHGIGKCQKIRHIVRIRLMLKQWRRKARITASSSSSNNNNGRAPSDVPAGHVAVCVGTSLRRYIVRATYLNHPIFKKLLVQTEEEYGFNNVGPLTIPCDESFFEEILRVVSRSGSSNSGRFSTFEDLQRCCHVGMKNKLGFFSESRPLLHGADKSVY